MELFARYRTPFLTYLQEQLPNKAPEALYEPSTYIMNLGGKRMRPLLTLMAADAFSNTFEEALPAALAVEMFHNFSLVHDDIMDAAPLRRGQPTVHHKWDVNTGILSGDVMLVLAYRYLESYPAPLFKQLTVEFSTMAQQVCEGQQWDMLFPTQENVDLEAYIQMIQHKTAVLVGCALKMGALIGGASNAAAQLCYTFGMNLGIAFQLQDDFLDAFGAPEQFGKQVGGDILENKKTFLYLHALANAPKEMKEELQQWYLQTKATEDKVQRVCSIFEQSGAKSAIKSEIQRYTSLATTALDQLDLQSNQKAPLEQMANFLLQREY
jgi:geranylgeranyl diphosphate synthase type II